MQCDFRVPVTFRPNGFQVPANVCFPRWLGSRRMTDLGRDRMVGVLAANASHWGIAAIEVKTQTQTLPGSALKPRRDHCDREH